MRLALLALVLVASQARAYNGWDNNVVGAWPLQGNRYDTSGNALTLTVTCGGVAYYATVDGKQGAGKFLANNFGFVFNLTNLLGGKTRWTMEWDQYCITEQGRPNLGGVINATEWFHTGVNQYPGPTTGWFRDVNNIYRVELKTALTKSTWQNLAITKDGNTVKMYLNNTLLHTRTGDNWNITQTANANFYMGIDWYFGCGSRFDGYMANVIISDTVRTSFPTTLLPTATPTATETNTPPRTDTNTPTATPTATATPTRTASTTRSITWTFSPTFTVTPTATPTMTKTPSTYGPVTIETGAFGNPSLLAVEFPVSGAMSGYVTLKQAGCLSQIGPTYYFATTGPADVLVGVGPVSYGQSYCVSAYSFEDICVGACINIPYTISTYTPTVTKTNTPTKTITKTRTPTPTDSPTLTLTYTKTPRPTRTATPTTSPTPTATRSVTKTATKTATRTASETRTATPTRSPTPVYSVTASPTVTPTATPLFPVLTVSSAGYDTMKLVWRDVQGFPRYWLFKATSASRPEAVTTIIPQGTQVYFDHAVTPGRSYYYWLEGRTDWPSPTVTETATQGTQGSGNVGEIIE